MTRYMCPFFDPKENKCTLWKTQQDSYAIDRYCMSQYPESHTSCPNYQNGKHWVGL